MYLYMFNVYIYMKSVHVKQAYAVWRHDWYLFRILCYFLCLQEGFGFVTWKQSTPVRTSEIISLYFLDSTSCWDKHTAEGLDTDPDQTPCLGDPFGISCVFLPQQLLELWEFSLFSFCLQGFSCLSLALSAKSEGNVPYLASAGWILQPSLSAH